MNRYQYFQKIISFIILLIKEAQSLTEQEINDILEGRVTVKIVLKPKNSKQLNTQIKTTILKAVSSTEENTNSVDQLEASSTGTEICSTEGLELKSEPLKIEQLAERLQNLDTREEGLRILTDLCPAKKDLQSLAIQIDIPNSKKDSIQTLRERIIEATIGYRLRSRAIQGEPIETKWLKTQTPESDLIEATQDEATPTQTKELDAETPQKSQPNGEKLMINEAYFDNSPVEEAGQNEQ